MYCRGKINVDTNFKQFLVLQVSCTNESHDSSGVLDHFSEATSLSGHKDKHHYHSSL